MHQSGAAPTALLSSAGYPSGVTVSTLDLQSSVPLYAQLVDRFRQMIQSREFQPGDRFPAELDLMKEYGVARITVRRAISELEREGLLVRARAKGTFVATPKIERELLNVASFTERMQARGLQVGSRVLGVSIIAASPRIVAALQIAADAPVVEIQRVRTTNTEPTALETSYVSLDRCPGVDEVDFSRSSLYQVLETRYGLKAAESHKTLELTFATNREARLLQIAANAPLFLLTSTTSTADGTVMEYVKSLLRADRFRFQI
jgi:GntR family transcriptional regulator